MSKGPWFLAVLLWVACDSRTALRLSPCSEEGATTACQDLCGQGVRTCRGGFLGACEVPPKEIPCNNLCGQGIERCEGGRRSGLCEVAPVVKECQSMCGVGTETCTDNVWQPCTAPKPKAPKLTATIRDFRKTHPDFSSDGHLDLGIVRPQLGADDKPIYASATTTPTTHGAENFNQWFRDVPGVNLTSTLEIPLAASKVISKGGYFYENREFFPIDQRFFGNEGEIHNYGFSLEVATRFRYNGPEVFTFGGDDDIWVFINRRLVIDLGGIHSMETRTIELNSLGQELGLLRGEIYPMHIFFAERHVVASNFILSTTISEFDVCD